MWKLGIATVITVYLMIALVLFLCIKFIKLITRKKNFSIPTRRTFHFVVLVLVIYLIPLTGLSICLVCCKPVISLITLFAIFLSYIPVTKYVIIPLSERKHIKIIEK